MSEPDSSRLTGERLEEALVNLITDPAFVRLGFESRRGNFLSVLGRSFAEQWHSALLAWLLDPEAEHGLGVGPLQRFIVTLLDPKRSTSNSLRRAVLCATLSSDVEVQAEYFIPAVGRLDVWVTGRFGESDSAGSGIPFSIVVENKIRAPEADDQTCKYAAWIEKRKAQSLSPGEYIDLRVFLAPAPPGAAARQPQDPSFIAYSYQELYEELLQPCLQDPGITQFGRELLDQYVCNLRSPAVEGKRAYPMAKIKTDEELISQISTKHKEVLKLIVLHWRGEVLPELGTGPAKGFIAGELGDLVQRGQLKEGMRLGIRGREVTADATVQVQDGIAGLLYQGEFYSSPSTPATKACGSARNGWITWRVLEADGQPGPTLADLRKTLSGAPE